MKTIRNSLSFILAFFLMLSLLSVYFTAELRNLITNREMYRNIACSEGITRKQIELIEKKIGDLAGKYHFDPESVSAMVTTESLHGYAGRCIDWWMDAITGKSDSEIPVWPYEEMMATVRDDSEFTVFVPKYEQRTTARDKVAVPLANTITSAVLCVRTELVQPVVEKVSAKINLNMISRFLHTAPWIFLLTSLLLAGLIILIVPRGNASGRIGYAFGGCVPVILLLIILLRFSGLPETVRESSVILAEQTTALLNGITLRMAIAAFCCLILYFACGMKGKDKHA